MDIPTGSIIHNLESRSAGGRTVRAGSRKSQLAMVQTEYVIARLKEINPDINFYIVGMDTLGDDILSTALSKIGEKSLFTKELEIALQKNAVDFVVHSLKDLPSTLPDGMVIAAILERENPQDAVVLRVDHAAHMKQAGIPAENYLLHLPPDSIIGTSSLRRAAQLKRRYPHLRFLDVRGNLSSRLRKLDDPGGPFDALILAAAGLIRLGWEARISTVLPSSLCLHAVGQGALAVECRQNDEETISLLRSLVHPVTTICCVAERSFLKKLSLRFRATDQQGYQNIDGGISNSDRQAYADSLAASLLVPTCLQLMFKLRWSLVVTDFWEAPHLHAALSLPTSRWTEGGCSVPCAVSSHIADNKLRMEGGVYSLDGSVALEKTGETFLEDRTNGHRDVPPLDSSFVSVHPQDIGHLALCNAVETGLALAKRLEDIGATEVLREARNQARTANIISIKTTGTKITGDPFVDKPSGATGHELAVNGLH